MKKIIVGIFAHPDDEAFGPSGTLLMETKAGTELHLITLTAGEAGTNPDNLSNLAEVRLQEWHSAGQLIGATEMHHLGYVDGTLNNLDHLTITDEIIRIVEDILDGEDNATIEFMSIDLNGVTGHIDHIVAGRSACLAFYRLKAKGYPMSRIRLACRPGSKDDVPNTDFVFMDAGRSPEEIGETIDARQYANEVIEIMRCHRTQRHDCENHIAALGDDVAINHFIVLE
ncbi:PIG-L family deacetylase [Candidatus Saccharibacteria bacterium]|nr:PIG-L family deacetylase [Candidatus Saccharibacteria bacterium]